MIDGKMVWKLCSQPWETKKNGNHMRFEIFIAFMIDMYDSGPCLVFWRRHNETDYVVVKGVEAISK